MNDGFSLSPDYFVHFMLVFFRLGSVVIFAPFFNHSSFPTILRISLALLLSLVIFPLQIRHSSWLQPQFIFSF